MEPIVIDCDTCMARDHGVCEDCVVTYVCGPEVGGALVVDVQEYRALRMLHEGGLVPRLRHRRGA